MYSPGFYRENRDQLILELVREEPFAVLLTVGGEQVSHLPILLDSTNGEKPFLFGHMARANPHWRELSEKGRSKVLFQGPHGYISPAWYTPTADNVPTWNYAVVHVTGRFEVIDEPVRAFAEMDRMVMEFESRYKTGWSLPRGEKAVDDLMKGIVVFKITDLQFEGKFKLSQKQSSINRENTMLELKKTGVPELIRLADKMAASKVAADGKGLGE